MRSSLSAITLHSPSMFHHGTKCPTLRDSAAAGGFMYSPIGIEEGTALRVPGRGLPDAVLGTSIDVPTLDGQISVEVPAGTQPDSMLRLRGKGLPSFGGGARGDLFIRLQVHVPERLTDRQKQLFEQLRTSTTRRSSSKS